MRKQLTKKSFTKPERIIGEILKRNRIPFETKIRIGGREIDFLVGKVVIEVGNHLQNTKKNKFLMENGYSTLFLTNREIMENRQKVEKHLLVNWLKKHE